MPTAVAASSGHALPPRPTAHPWRPSWLLLPLALLQPAVACAQQWPVKPIRIVVPFAAGGNTDSIARISAERLNAALEQPVLVDNKPGGNGVIAAEIVARANADGYTLLMMPMALAAILPALPASTRLPYDPVKDFAPVTNIGVNSFALGISAALAARTVREFVAHVKGNPGKLNYASGGSGSVSHLSGALFVHRAGLAMTHISYKGGAPAVADLLSGQVQMYFGNLSELAPHAQGGRLRVIGVSSERRAPQLPEVPTIAESGYPGFRTLTWNGLVAPAGTPAAIVRRIAEESAAICTAPATVQRLTQIGVDPLCSTPAEFAATIRSDLVFWSQAIRSANLRIE